MNVLKASRVASQCALPSLQSQSEGRQLQAVLIVSAVGDSAVVQLNTEKLIIIIIIIEIN
jgi:hypothetical protein